MQPGPDGRLWAINPEAGFFGVAPGTSLKTNPNMMGAIRQNSIFTNVALLPTESLGGREWSGPVPPQLADWRGNPWAPGEEKAAHPNSRFTTPAHQCPSISVHGRLARGPHLGHHFRWPPRPGRSHWCTNPLTGNMGYLWAPQWPPKPPPRRLGQWVWCVTTRWPCCPSAATTWRTISATGWQSVGDSAIRRKSSL